MFSSEKEPGSWFPVFSWTLVLGSWIVFYPIVLCCLGMILAGLGVLSTTL